MSTFGLVLLILLIGLMPVLARMSGGGFGAHLLNRKGAKDEKGRDKGGKIPYVGLNFLPEVLFALPFAILGKDIFKQIYLGMDLSYVELKSLSAFTFLVFWGLAWRAIELGHGTAYHMGRNPKLAQGVRKQSLSVLVDPLCRALKQPLGGTFYCWTFMGLKGFLIHATLGWFALLAIVLWPSVYYVGQRIWRDKYGEAGYGACETLSGLVSSFLLALTLYYRY